MTAVPVTLPLPTAADTLALGGRIAMVARAGDLVVLAGPLGAGKTVLAKGIGAGLGVTGPVVSPTFVLCRGYCDGRLPMVHVDAYRLGSAAELDDLDLDAAVAESVTVIEWGSGIAEALAEEYLLVDLRPDERTEARTARLRAVGRSWSDRLAELLGPTGAAGPAGRTGRPGSPAAGPSR